MKCKDDNGGITEVGWRLIDGAYLPAASVCDLSLYNPEHTVPRLTGLEISNDGENLFFSWVPNNIFYTFGYVKVNDGDWQYWVDPSWGGDTPGESEWSMPLNFYGDISDNDIIYVRMRFGYPWFANLNGGVFGEYSDTKSTTVEVVPA